MIRGFSVLKKVYREQDRETLRQIRLLSKYARRGYIRNSSSTETASSEYFFVGRIGIKAVDFSVSQVDTAEASEQSSMESDTFNLSPQNRQKVVEIL